MSRRARINAAVIAVVAAVAVVSGGVVVSQLGDDGPAAAASTKERAEAQSSQRPSGSLETPKASPTPTVTPTPTKKPAKKPSPTAVLSPGASGDKVRELQARLKQIQWYEPKISGTFDPVTVEAVKGFQGKRGFTATGVVDQRTWDKLVEMTRTPTDDELHNRIVAGPTIIGPGDSGDEVRELQARLKQIGWFSGEITPTYGDATRQSVAGFQLKRGFPATGEVDQRTWDKLVEMTRTPTDDELHNREPAGDDQSAAGLDPRCVTGRVLCIDKSTNQLRWVVEGDVYMTLAVRFGSELTPTREGSFQVNWKSRDHVSSLYDTPMPYAMFFSGGQAVHYSPDFAANGYNGASHGCVNVRDKGAIASLFDQVNVGDKVIVYRS